MTPIFIGVVVATATAVLLSSVAWALRRRGIWLRTVGAAALVVAVIGSGQGVAMASWSYDAIEGHHTYVNNPGGCLYVSAFPGMGQWTPVAKGLPRMDSYGSIDWNSHPDGTGTPCGNTSMVLAGHSFYIVQVLRSWNLSTNSWDICNWGQPVWNPAPFSHEVRTGYSWPDTPCPQGAGNYYSMQMSIADQYGAGYGAWAYADGHIFIDKSCFTQFPSLQCQF